MSSEISVFLGDGSPEDGSPEELAIPIVDEQLDQRPDLSALGIEEHERGICDDTYENRNILRRAKLRYQAVYDQYGKATGWISAFTTDSLIERRILSLAEKKPLLVDDLDRNSDYLTGLDLLLEDDVHHMVPPWVIGATKRWNAEQEAGGPTTKREPMGLPHRCRVIKSDGIRCMLWGSGKKKDDGVCRIHLRTSRRAGDDIERARRKLVQAAPYAVDVLEELMEGAESEPVRLKASTEILDRAGIRGGQDINVDVEVSDNRPAAQVITERLARLAAGAASMQARIEGNNSDNTDIVDAEIVEEDVELLIQTTDNSDGGPPAAAEELPPDTSPLDFEDEDLNP